MTVFLRVSHPNLITYNPFTDKNVDPTLLPKILTIIAKTKDHNVNCNADLHYQYTSEGDMLELDLYDSEKSTIKENALFVYCIEDVNYGEKTNIESDGFISGRESDRDSDESEDIV